MASNDDAQIFTVSSRNGQVDHQALNDVIRRILEILYAIEGRTGESTIRDSLTVMGDLTVDGDITVDGGIEACGDILPCEDATHDIGSSALRWQDLNLSGDIQLEEDSIIFFANDWEVGPIGNDFIFLNDQSSAGITYQFQGVALPFAPRFTIDLTQGSDNEVILRSVPGVGSNGPDIVLEIDDAATNVEVGRFTADRSFIQRTANMGQWISGQNSEEITITAADTDSIAQLLPANSLIKGVVGYVTSTILRNGVNAGSWAIGDPTTTARFAAANASVTTGSTSVGLQHWQGSVFADASGPVQPAADVVRIRVAPAAGATYSGSVRITVFYEQFIAPTS